ncbi:MAG: T9SS type A sorting domain-containing protein [Bacteroidales bacterium]|nr:T9SS type A sorting domain-containing protein [Bacteroidales bacterium]
MTESAGLGFYDGNVLTITRSGNTIYAGGKFTVAGGTFARNIAKWTGGKWEALGEGYENGIRGSVYAILVDGNDIYAGGYFGSAGTSEAYHIAKFDGTRWRSLGIGVGGVPGAYVKSLVKVGDYLYVAGYFSVVGDEENYELPTNSIARFNLVTNRWESLGRGIEYVYGIPGVVNDMDVYENRIFVGGEFQSADDMYFHNFVVIEENKFTGIGGIQNVGIEGKVKTVKYLNNEIYIGGYLQLQLKGESYGILKWDADQWVKLNEQLQSDQGDVIVNDIEPYKDGIIAGGIFSRAGNSVFNNLAYYDGEKWNDLAGGVLPGVSNLAVLEEDIFVSGPLVISAGKSACVAMARYFKDKLSGVEKESDEKRQAGITNFPNPFTQSTSIYYSLSSPGKVKITVTDGLGREIKIVINEFQDPGNYVINFDAQNLPAGLYFCHLSQGNKFETKKMLVVK